MNSIIRTRRKVQRAFTLVEILIVVVILGILAAIVIPQFTSASEEAAANSTHSQLQTIRSQIELYKMRNVGDLPFDAGDLIDLDLLVSDGYLQSVPANGQVDAAFGEVVVATGGDYSAAGWASDAAGMIFAINKAGDALEDW